MLLRMQYNSERLADCVTLTVITDYRPTVQRHVVFDAVKNYQTTVSSLKRKL